jgi:hypothetical protein
VEVVVGIGTAIGSTRWVISVDAAHFDIGWHDSSVSRAAEGALGAEIFMNL